MYREQSLQNTCNTVFRRDMICLRCITVNTLHKNNDDDYNIDQGCTNPRILVARANTVAPKSFA